MALPNQHDIFNFQLRAVYAQADTDEFTQRDSPTVLMTAIFDLDESEQIVDQARDNQVVMASITWMTEELAASSIKPDDILQRTRDLSYWRVMGKPEDDNSGEASARLKQISRNRIGGQ